MQDCFLYMIKPGDSWQSIAQMFYGDQRAFDALRTHNKRVPFRQNVIIEIPLYLGEWEAAE